LSYTVVGDTVNTASRLSDVAGIGAVYAGRETAAATMASASWRGLPPLRLKGKRELVEAYELVRLRSSVPTRFGVGDEAALVGREAEFGMLVGALNKVVDTAAPSTVVILGDAGMGKSRLAGELARHAAQIPGTRVLWGHCSPFGLGRDLQPLAEMVRTACGIEPDDSLEQVADRLSRALARLDQSVRGEWSAPKTAERLMAVLGMDVPDGPRLADLPRDAATPGARVERGEIDALAALLAALADEGPLVLITDDLHHAQGSTLAALRDLGARLHGPVLAIGLARTNVLHPVSLDLLHNMPDPQVLPLEPLDDAAGARLLRVYLGGAQLAEPVQQELVARAQGNPFFLGEMLHLLVDNGSLRPGADGTWQLVGALPREIPVGVRAVLAARIDSLEPPARALLRDASVLGPSFPAAALPALDPRLDPDSVEPQLGAMVERGILTPEDRGRWSFTHTLTRDVAYAGLPKADRARRHAAAALWALEQMEGGPGVVDAFVGVQADRAVRLAVEMALPRSDPAWSAGRVGLAASTRLGQEAVRRSDYPGAEVHLLRAERLAAAVQAPAEARLPASVAYAEALAGMRRLDDAEQYLREPLASGQPSIRAAALVVAGDVASRRRDYIAARTALVQAFVLAGENGLDAITSAAIRQLGLIDFFEGKLGAAEERFQQACDLARRVGDERGAAWALQHLAWSATTRGEYGVAEGALREAGKVFVQLRDGGGLGWCAGTEAFVRLLQGRLAEARDVIRGLLPLARSSGSAWEVATCLTIDALAAVDLGALDEADAALAEASANFERLGDSWGRGLAAIGTGQLARAQGRPAESAAAFRNAVEVIGTEGHNPMAVLATVSLGLLHLDGGDIDGAEFEADRATKMVESVDVLTGALIGLWVLRSRLDRVRGRVDEAEELLRESLESGIPSYLFPRRQAYAHLAAAQLEQGRVPEAHAMAERALAEPAEDVRSRVVAQRVLGQILARRGDAAAAEAAVREAVAVAEEHGYTGEAATARALLARLPG
ncbi:MAG TPA: AAA family ATPase, partial [Mycobacteriales bacterium]|nr:AAA family ATPase [Mycobacteriales bacterium]